MQTDYGYAPAQIPPEAPCGSVFHHQTHPRRRSENDRFPEQDRSSSICVPSKGHLQMRDSTATSIHRLHRRSALLLSHSDCQGHVFHLKLLLPVPATKSYAQSQGTSELFECGFHAANVD